MRIDAPSLPAVFDAFGGFQRTAAVRAAVELDVFTAVGEGCDTVDALAARCNASGRGLRALCDRLTVDGLLAKRDGRWSLSATAAAFLDRRSPAYLGSVLAFLASETIVAAFTGLTEAVRRGGTVIGPEGTMAPDHPVWVQFARAMLPLARMQSELLAGVVPGPYGRVLDVAAGHGLFGIALLARDPAANVEAVDWASVLGVAEEQAHAAGVAARWRAVPGSAFTVDLQGPYDTILLTNFLHHFDPPTNVQLLERMHGALAPGGRCVTLEFVVDEDRTAPREAASFALVMLATTAAGDAYTFTEYEAMFRAAGFAGSTLHDLLPAPTRVIVSTRAA